MFNHSRIPRHMLLEQPNLGASLGRRLGVFLLVLLLGIGVGMAVSEAHHETGLACAKRSL